VTATLEHPARARPDGKDVTRPKEALWTRLARGERANGAAAIRRGDTGRGAVRAVDADRELSAVWLAVFSHHQRQGELGSARPRQGHAHDAAGMAQHEDQPLEREALGSDDQVPFVLPLRVISHDDKLATTEGRERGLDFDG
jgi:hypothetical protein